MINGGYFQQWIVLFVIMDKNHFYLRFDLCKKIPPTRRKKYPFFKRDL
ncbi:hypothetical protein LEP1GSC035_1325 [Leptospira noguchii str. 2007001578]|uniref:SLEI domain protein, PF07620 family n=1 Tax=Leptospira noguchii str. 2007001578 TaxID=1049974 RepID=A0ABN0IVD7_9LEPT|nr:hypothetical protein LEP1GSC035_1325 [Leptospira noguchii str. 2007001578]